MISRLPKVNRATPDWVALTPASVNTAFVLNSVLISISPCLGPVRPAHDTIILQLRPEVK